MIIQHDLDKQNNAIAIDQAIPNRLVVAAFSFLGGECAGDDIDLASFQGGPFRLYLEADGSLSTELFRDHYWLLAEATLPEKQYDNVPTGQTDEYGNPKMELVERVLDLNDIDIFVFSLPEVG